MNHPLRPWLLLCLGLTASCERSEKHGRQIKDENPGPVATRAARPLHEAMTDSHEAMRAALSQADALADPAAREKALSQVAWNALGQNEEIAREAFAKLAPDGPERIALVQHFAMRMADENVDAALEWSATLATEKEIASARARIATVLAATDPARAANLLSESGLASREFDVAIVQVLRQWAGQSAPDAAAWVAVFPEGGFRKAGVEAVISQWTASDPQGAVTWLSSLSDDGLRAEATAALGKALRKQTTETREAWLKAADAPTRTALEHAATK